MHDRLKRAWLELGYRVVSPMGSVRHVVNADGATVVSGGYQRELDYLLMNHAGVLNGQQ